MSGNRPSPRAELLLHPVRARIVVEFSGRRRTVGELAAALPDLPQSTLYRQVGVLVDGGILEVVEQRATTGPDERVYRIADGAGRVPVAEIDSVEPDDQLRYFSVYTASLIDTLAAYLAPGDAVPSRDGLGYIRVGVHLTDAERASFAARLGELVEEALALPPAPDRRRYHVANVVIPDPRSRE
jgi:DNA-binding transcriptional ArsR family regulator